MVGARTFLPNHLLRRLRTPRLGPGRHPPGDRLMIREEVVAVVDAVKADTTADKRLSQRAVEQPHVDVPVVRLQHLDSIDLLSGLRVNRLLERPSGIGDVMKRPHLALQQHEREDLLALRPWQVLSDLRTRPERRLGPPHDCGQFGDWQERKVDCVGLQGRRLRPEIFGRHLGLVIGLVLRQNFD